MVEPEPPGGIHPGDREVIAALACRFARHPAGTWTRGGAGFRTAGLGCLGGFPRARTSGGPVMVGGGQGGLHSPGDLAWHIAHAVPVDEHGYGAVVVRVALFRKQDGQRWKAGWGAAIGCPDRLAVECLAGDPDLDISRQPHRHSVGALAGGRRDPRGESALPCADNSINKRLVPSGTHTRIWQPRRTAAMCAGCIGGLTTLCD